MDDDGLITTKYDVEQGLDPQNIPWDRLQVSRQRYRVSHCHLEAEASPQ